MEKTTHSTKHRTTNHPIETRNKSNSIQAEKLSSFQVVRAYLKPYLDLVLHHIRLYSDLLISVAVLYLTAKIAQFTHEIFIMLIGSIS